VLRNLAKSRGRLGDHHVVRYDRAQLYFLDEKGQK